MLTYTYIVFNRARKVLTTDTVSATDDNTAITLAARLWNLDQAHYFEVWREGIRVSRTYCRQESTRTG